MKKLALWTIISMFTLGLGACAGGSGGGDVRVKCPLCGYEFDVETQDG